MKGVADEIDELAFRIEAGARAHQCMGADCATCHPKASIDIAIAELWRRHK